MKLWYNVQRQVAEREDRRVGPGSSETIHRSGLSRVMLAQIVTMAQRALSNDAYNTLFGTR